MRTAFEIVDWSAHRAPEATALLDPETGSQVTYAELMARIECVAAELAGRGVVAGELIATAMPNTIEHAIVLLALNRLGAVPAIINPRLKVSEVNQLISRGNIRGFIHLQQEGASSVAPADIEDAAGILVTAESLSGQRVVRPGDVPSFARPKAEDPAFVFYTSGTTGLPKGVVIPHRAIEPRVLFMSTQGGLRFGSSNTALGLMPIHHVIGFFGVFLTVLAFNGTWIPVATFDPGRTIRFIEAFRVTCLFASPTHFDSLLTTPDFASERFNSVENLIFAGSAMNESTLQRLNDNLHIPVVNIYGTTEAMNSLYSPDAARESRLRPGYHSRVQIAGITDSPKNALATGVEGELVVDAAAESTFTHYLNNPDATEVKLVDGWYRTGDSGYVDEDGFVILTGRIDDMINTGAENVHAEEVESVISRHPAVVEAAVVGLPDTRWGEVVTAVVVVSDRVAVEDLDRLCLESELANFKRPRQYFLVDELPRNKAMKISRRTLRDHLRVGEVGGPDPVTGFIHFKFEESE